FGVGNCLGLDVEGLPALTMVRATGTFSGVRSRPDSCGTGTKVIPRSPCFSHTSTNFWEKIKAFGASRSRKTCASGGIVDAFTHTAIFVEPRLQVGQMRIPELGQLKPTGGAKISTRSGLQEPFGLNSISKVSKVRPD